MGQTIEAGPLVGTTRVTLECDGDHGLLHPHRSIWTNVTDYIAMRAQATKEGWRRIDGGSWRGPCCTGGKTRAMVE